MLKPKMRLPKILLEPPLNAEKCFDLYNLMIDQNKVWNSGSEEFRAGTYFTSGSLNWYVECFQAYMGGLIHIQCRGTSSYSITFLDENLVVHRQEFKPAFYCLTGDSLEGVYYYGARRGKAFGKVKSVVRGHTYVDAYFCHSAQVPDELLEMFVNDPDDVNVQLQIEMSNDKTTPQAMPVLPSSETMLTEAWFRVYGKHHHTSLRSME